MKVTLLLTFLLITGLVLSQALPNLLGEMPQTLVSAQKALTLTFLSYIMIEVGREFEIDLTQKRKYAWDYLVAATAATFPWIFVVIYFLIFLAPENHSDRTQWIDALLLGRFAAPTSAGVLLTLLAAAGLAHTWVFKKTRILVIFDDLDTVLLMIPLQILALGFAWQLIGVNLVVAIILYAGIRNYRKLDLPSSWPWILTYSFAVMFASEGLYALTKSPATGIGLHIEVLLPAFLLGCAIKPKAPQDLTLLDEVQLKTRNEETARLIISGSFMFLVGFSMPIAFGKAAQIENMMSPGVLAFHVLAVTFLSNLGKMFVAFCYRKEATLRERLAVAVSMFPRGEVGAGVLAVSLSYGVSGPMVPVAFLSLALNLALTGGFIAIVKALLPPGKRESHRVVHDSA